MDLFKKNINFKINSDLKGAKGRSQPAGGGTAALKPPDSSANLFQSISYLSALDLISEGPIDGFSNSVDGTRCIGSDILSSIFYDDIPLKQPVERKYAIKPIKSGDIKEMGIAAVAEDDTTTSLFKAISGEIDELEGIIPGIGSSTNEKYPLSLSLYFVRGQPLDYTVTQYDWNLTLTNGGNGYLNDFSSEISFRENTYGTVVTKTIFFKVTSQEVVGIGESSAEAAQENTTITIELPSTADVSIGAWKVVNETLKAPEEISYDRETLQIESRVRALREIQSRLPTGNSSPFGYIQYRLNDTFDFSNGGSEDGIKMYPSTKVYLSNTWDNNGNLYERYFKDDYLRSFEINADFIEGAFQFDETSPISPDISQGKTQTVYDATGLEGYGYLLFYIGDIDYTGVGGNFDTGKFLRSTTDVNYSAYQLQAYQNNFDFFGANPSDNDELFLSAVSREQVAPSVSINEGEKIYSCFFVENFRNLNFNNASIDYRLGEETQDFIPIYASGSRDYSINFQLYGFYTGIEDVRETGGGLSENYSDWSDTTALPADYDEFSYTHIIQQRQVEKAVPTVNIQKLFDTQHTGSEDLGKKLKNTLNIRVEYGFEGDDIPLGFNQLNNELLSDSDNNSIVSAAAAQGISPEAIILQSYKEVEDFTFEGIVDYAYYTQLDVGTLPRNTDLEDKTYGDYFNTTQLNTFGITSSDPVFPGGKWKDINRYIKVRKNNQESESILIGRECALASVTEYLNSNFNYPFSALVGNTVDARSFSQSPQRRYQARMKKILIPSNYFPLRADGSDKRFRSSEFGVGEFGEYVYYGEWDGTFRLAWSDNPAWILYDLITNTRYGVGNQIDDLRDIDIFELYTIGRYSDAVDEYGRFVGLSDGNGGLEPRFSCNLAIDQVQNAFQMIGNVASIFRGMTYWSAGTLNFSIDKPKPISAIFNNENVFDGIFNYGDIPAQNRFTRVSVSYMDKRDEYKVKKEYVDDEEGIRNYGIIVKDVNALGTTSRSQARRMGQYILLSNKLETETVQFQTDARALTLAPGDIIRIDDELKHFEINYGKVLNKSVEDGWIEIDDQINTGNISLNADSALYLYNDSFDQNDLSSLYDISQFENNLVLTGESLTLAAINNEDTHNIFAKFGEQYTGFKNWNDLGTNTIQGPFNASPTNKLFSLPQYESIKDDNASEIEGVQLPINYYLEKGQKISMSLFTVTGNISFNDVNDRLLYRIRFSGIGESSSNVQDHGINIYDGRIDSFFPPDTSITGIEYGVHEEINMPDLKWSRPYITFEALENGKILYAELLFVPTASTTINQGIEIAAPQLEIGDRPTPFNSNNFHANNSINKFTITGVDNNESPNGYRLYLDRTTTEYSTFNETPIGSHFNVKLDNGLEELYKIIKVSPQENNLYSVEGLQYYSGKFEQIENETYLDENVIVNVGIPLNTVTRPAPAQYIDYTVDSAVDEFGEYYIQASIGKLGETSAEKYRISLLYPNGSYSYKEADLGENGTAIVYFLQLPVAGTYTVKITSLKNPEARVAEDFSITIPSS